MLCQTALVEYFLLPFFCACILCEPCFPLGCCVFQKARHCRQTSTSFATLIEELSRSRHPTLSRKLAQILFKIILPLDVSNFYFVTDKRAGIAVDKLFWSKQNKTVIWIVGIWSSKTRSLWRGLKFEWLTISNIPVQTKSNTRVNKYVYFIALRVILQHVIVRYLVDFVVP